MINQSYRLNMIPGGVPVRIPVSQYDAGSRTLVFDLVGGSTAFSVPSGAAVTIDGTKPDGHSFSYTATASGSTVSAEVTDQMAAVAGVVDCQLTVRQGDAVLGSANFALVVERAALPADPDLSESDWSSIEEAIKQATQAVTAANASASAAAGSAATAKDKAAEATASATAAKNSETAAKTSQTGAAGSAATATTKAQEAANSASAANTSQNAAKTSETKARNSASAAKTSQTAAAGSATTATTKAQEASTSAANAKTSETNAQNSAMEATASATAAKNSETAAKTSQTGAAGSAATATTKAQEAANSASAANTSQNAAKTSETKARNSASAAKTSQTAAAGSATTATTKAQEASTSAANAKTSETNAQNSAMEATASAASAAEAAANAVSGKADKTVPATAGNIALLDANGNLADGGVKLPLPISAGGTGATNAEAARTALGVAPSGLLEYTGKLTEFEDFWGKIKDDLATLKWANGSNHCIRLTSTDGSYWVSAGELYFWVIYSETAITYTAFGTDYGGIDHRDNVLFIAHAYKSSSGWTGYVEWGNPPMVVGVEYRTTERFGGVPVYTKLMNLGAVAADKTIEIPAHNYIRYFGTWGTNPLPLNGSNDAYYLYLEVNPGGKFIKMHAGGIAGDSADVFAQLWYTN